MASAKSPECLPPVSRRFLGLTQCRVFVGRDLSQAPLRNSIDYFVRPSWLCERQNATFLLIERIDQFNCHKRSAVAAARSISISLITYRIVEVRAAALGS
jgi:hypothetical protein